jgi:GDP-L-fucose synthase
MERYDEAGHINIGTGEDLANRGAGGDNSRRRRVARALCLYQSKPDRAPRRLLDVSRLARLGWRARIVLKDGICATRAGFGKLDRAISGFSA